MEKFENTEALLAWIVDFFSTSFGNSAILKGGMALRLMHSPRYTNDVDYIFVPFDSKRDVKDIVEKALSQVDGLRYESSMNSKALRILLTYGGQSAQIEINVEKGCPSIPMSSALLSTNHGRPTRILRIMEPRVSFAHKIAAWNERELMRDLYDMYQYESILRAKPQMDILKARLAKARSYANVVAAQDLDSLISKMTERANSLDESSLEELRPILSNDELAGLTFRLRASISALCEILRQFQ
ncbi:MAG: nucleotidyl transferase AbiEii/AbiGii toxin family protein [Fibrobacter sp.]|nr:nucleotidyl transferase AbiEii/AbiGii toxin family protein [Fibrobacter sp.]